MAGAAAVNMAQYAAQAPVGKGNGGLKISNEEVSLEGFIEKLCSFSAKGV